MHDNLIAIITSTKAHIRNRSLDSLCQQATIEELLAECAALDNFRRQQENLYQRVRALFFLYAIYRYHLPGKLRTEAVHRTPDAHIPVAGYKYVLERSFEEAIDIFLEAQQQDGPSDAIASSLATAYRELGFQTLSNQVSRSVQSFPGNEWMFFVDSNARNLVHVRSELFVQDDTGAYPILRECIPVRMDLSHSGWSDIFFLAMDFPEGARVLNISIDLGVHGRDSAPKPPVECYLRVITEPVLRLTSIDLHQTVDLRELSEVFDFGADYLGLLKAAIIVAGIVPPGIAGSNITLGDLLKRTIGIGLGLEIVSSVNNVPKGSRLAVSTSLLSALISVCMRATGQAASFTGQLSEPERRLVASRAILGEWLGGSGGGWQDSGGIWPGAKLIRGVRAQDTDPETGISHGRLLPNHTLLDIPTDIRDRLQDCLVLVHGGMAQNVGPVLEMVTEKYLLRSEAEWKGRQEAMKVFDEILAALGAGDVKGIAAATTRNFFGPIQTIIPWATNRYTETIVNRVREQFGERFWGFWMLGGMSGGGMGFIFSPGHKPEAQRALANIMSQTKRELESALPFVMEPVVYDFAINERGSWCACLKTLHAQMPSGYAALTQPATLNATEIVDKVGEIELRQLLGRLGFDSLQHDQIREDLKSGRVGLAQNRLPITTVIEDVHDEDVVDARSGMDTSSASAAHQLGLQAIRNGEAAVVTLAAGVGSRWTQGAGVVKALHPFCKLAGKYRSFLDIHIAKVRRVSRQTGMEVPHIVTTSYMTHRQIQAAGMPVILSPGNAVGLRLIPTVRDLQFAWNENTLQRLDQQKQRVRESVQAAAIAWAQNAGEAADYTDNLAGQCLNPVGHWFEISNMLINGVLKQLIDERPQLRYLMLHNIDTVGTDLDATMLGLHIQGRSCLSFEVIPRRMEDRGGGLGRVDGRLRLIEGLAMPREEDELKFRFYNSLTTWIDIDQLLGLFGLTRSDLHNEAAVAVGIHAMAAKMPTYITLKEVKRRWGNGQEDVFNVAQYEKLWGDMTTLPEVDCRYFVVSRLRGQQLKDITQLDGWFRDGSATYVEGLCDWPEESRD